MFMLVMLYVVLNTKSKHFLLKQVKICENGIKECMARMEKHWLGFSAITKFDKNNIPPPLTEDMDPVEFNRVVEIRFCFCFTLKDYGKLRFLRAILARILEVGSSTINMLRNIL